MHAHAQTTHTSLTHTTCIHTHTCVHTHTHTRNACTHTHDMCAHTHPIPPHVLMFHLPLSKTLSHYNPVPPPQPFPPPTARCQPTSTTSATTSGGQSRWWWWWRSRRRRRRWYCWNTRPSPQPPGCTGTVNPIIARAIKPAKSTPGGRGRRRVWGGGQQ